MKEARSSNAVSEIDLIQARSNMQIAEAALADAEAALNTGTDQFELLLCTVALHGAYFPYGLCRRRLYIGCYFSGTSVYRVSGLAVYAYFS